MAQLSGKPISVDCGWKPGSGEPLRVAARLRDLNESGLGFLIADLDMAIAFMDVADVSKLPETRERNRRNAQKAYETVERLLQKLEPDAAWQAKIDLKLAVLKRRLVAAGEA